MAKAREPEKVSFAGRLKQIGMVFSYTAKRDRRFVPLVAVGAAIPLVIAIVLILIGGGLLWLPVGILGALLGVMIVLSTRSRKAMLAEAEGQPGAAASIVETMGNKWRVHAAVAATTQFDVVHLVIGQPGVILIAEGNPQRVRSLLAQEKRRLLKVIGNADLRDLTIGNDEGQVPLRKLQSTLRGLTRLPGGTRLKPRDINALDKRITALSTRPQLPKGAIPKNMRPKGSFRAMRGR